MNNTDRQAHWQNVYATKAEKEVRWFQENPVPSLEVIAAAGIHATLPSSTWAVAPPGWLMASLRRGFSG